MYNIVIVTSHLPALASDKKRIGVRQVVYFVAKKLFPARSPVKAQKEVGTLLLLGTTPPE